jgi:hypothetical protein
MRSIHLIAKSLLFSIVLLFNFTTSKAQSGYYNSTYQQFYDDLSPYGQWLNDPSYGYVWMPNVGPDFRPYYTNGYWAMSEYGNTWVSNYQWGWAAFHYGRWTFDNYYGWLWIPGSEWAPAWVTWRSNSNYYGWAPMGPNVGINISLNLIPINWWVFLQPTYLYHNNFNNYCMDWRHNQNYYRQTQYVNYIYNDRRTVYYTGPNSNDYYRNTGRRPQEYTVNLSRNSRSANSNKNGSGRLNLYRPDIDKNDGRSSSRPTTFRTADVKVSTRMNNYQGSMNNLEGRNQVLNTRTNSNRNTINNSSSIRSSNNTQRNESASQNSRATNMRDNKVKQENINSSNSIRNNSNSSELRNMNHNQRAQISDERLTGTMNQMQQQQAAKEQQVREQQAAREQQMRTQQQQQQQQIREQQAAREQQMRTQQQQQVRQQQAAREQQMRTQQQQQVRQQQAVREQSMRSSQSQPTQNNNTRGGGKPRLGQ